MNVKNNYRTCIVNGKDALFHGWFPFDRVVVGGGVSTYPSSFASVIGIVEFEDGSIRNVYPEEIIFTDNLFSQYCFDNDDKDKKKDSYGNC